MSQTKPSSKQEETWKTLGSAFVVKRKDRKSYEPKLI